MKTARKPSSRNPQTIEEARAFVKHVESLFMPWNVEGIVAGFTEDCVVRFGDLPEFRGRAELEKFFRGRSARQGGGQGERHGDRMSPLSQMRKTWSVPVFVLLAACATPTDKTAGVERMYVISCGENHVKDVSRWTPGVNVGKPHVFSNHCYLIKHAQGWMLWDTGNADRLAALPGGLTVAGGMITAYMRKPLAESLKEIGVAPGDIKHFAMSHAHGDHSGNANLFSAATLYVQSDEYAAMFGPEPQKYGFIPANYEKLRANPAMIVRGDYDVFGDGTVTIKAAPGHTPGHQVLVVRLPKTGPVMLSGDMVHLQHSWNFRVAPSFNFDIPRTMATIDAMKAYAQRTGTQLWINHDREQHAKIPKAPAFVQ